MSRRYSMLHDCTWWMNMLHECCINMNIKVKKNVKIKMNMDTETGTVTGIRDLLLL
jgi:hypothetical protein